MRYRQIGLGTKIELELYDRKGDKVKPVLVSQYENYDEKINLMEIHVPFYEGNMVPVHPKTIMDVIFSKENDTYGFKAEALDREFQGGIAILKIKPVTPIEKIERRYFFRMSCQLEIQYRIAETVTDGEDNSEKTFIQTVTTDISGGGVCIVTDSKMISGTAVEAYLKLDRQVRFIGIIARSNEVREKGKILYYTGVEFKVIENRDRERIISYVFETQRDRLKKGLIRRDGENQ